MKKFKTIIIPLLCFAMFITGIAAYEHIEIRMSGIETDIPGRLVGTTTYVPFEDTNALLSGGEAHVTGDYASMHAVSDAVTVSAALGDCFIEASGRYLGGSDTMIIDGELYVPIRALAKAYSTDVEWQDATRSVNLTATDSTLASGDSFYDADEVYWLSRIIEAEACGEPMSGKVLVGNVIMNRVLSHEFPNTIYGVIFDDKHGIQFTPASTGTIYNTPSEDSVIAAKLVLDSYYISRVALYFLNPAIATNFWIPANRTYITTVGSHDFYA